MKQQATWHRLLKRQILRAGLDKLAEDSRVVRLLELVNEAYNSTDSDRKLFEHVMDLNTKELLSSNKRLQQSLTAAQVATKVKSDFLANMSHEIRTPLHGILGLLEMLRETELSPAQDKITTMAVDSAKGLQSVVDEILDFSKIEAGRLSIHAVPTDIRKSIEQVIALFSATLKSQKLNFISEFTATLPELILIDEFRLRQVLGNLLSNAVKFTQQEGAIIVFAFADHESYNRASLRVAVCDTGIGIPKDKLGAIFEPFSQADTSITRNFGGTGLGLPISLKIAQLMGGELWVRSIEGVGSVFHLAVPVTILRNFQSLSEAKKIDAPVRQGVRALLAEDNAVNQRIASHLLKKLGCSVITAVNGKEAVEIFAKDEFDIIIMDCQMPILSGFEATQKIRATEKGREIPIIALTAMAIEGDRERCLLTGMSDYLTKPVDKNKFAEIISRWTGCKNTD